MAMKTTGRNITSWEAYAPSYADAHAVNNAPPHDVPLKLPTVENLKDFGRIVHDYDKEEVWIEPWPSFGWRKVLPGTGVGGGVVEGPFTQTWVGDVIQATNDAIGMAPYVSGRLPADVSPQNRTHVLAREANYHSDGGQIFYPCNGDAFVALLAPSGDDVKLEDFVAFYFDGWYLWVANKAWSVAPTSVYNRRQGHCQNQARRDMCVRSSGHS